MKATLSIVPPKSAPDPLAEAQALVDQLASEQARVLETALCDLVELAERIASADAIRAPGVKEIARQAVTMNRTLALNLQAINARGSR